MKDLQEYGYIVVRLHANPCMTVPRDQSHMPIHVDYKAAMRHAARLATNFPGSKFVVCKMLTACEGVVVNETQVRATDVVNGNDLGTI